MTPKTREFLTKLADLMDEHGAGFRLVRRGDNGYINWLTIWVEWEPEFHINENMLDHEEIRQMLKGAKNENNHN